MLDERQSLTGRKEGGKHDGGKMGPMKAHFDGSVVRVGCAIIKERDQTTGLRTAWVRTAGSDDAE